MDAFSRLAITLALLWITPALALEPTGSLMGDAFLKTLEANGYQNAKAERVTRDAGALELAGVSAATPDGPRLTIAHVTLRSPALNADEALTAERIHYRGVRLDEPARGDGNGAATTIGAVTLNAPVLPTAPRGDARLSNLAGSFAALALTDLATTTRTKANGQSPLTLAGLALTLRDPDDGDGAGGRLVIDRLAFGADILDGATAIRLAALGIDTLSLDFVGEGVWHDETGRLALDTATIRAADLGTLALSGTLGGLTEATIARLRESIEDVPALLAALDAVTLGALTIAYVDEGLADKLIASAAADAGLDPVAYAAALTEQAGQFLSGLGDPAFADRAIKAAATFLADPGRIAISAAPNEPLSLAKIAGVALMRPDVLPAVLNLTIEAAP